MTQLNKTLDKWIDDNIEFLDSGSTGYFSGIDSGTVELKLIDLESRILELKDTLGKVSNALHNAATALHYQSLDLEDIADDYQEMALIGWEVSTGKGDGL